MSTASNDDSRDTRGQGCATEPPALQAWLAAARSDLQDREPPAWLRARVRADVQARCAERRVRRSVREGSKEPERGIALLNRIRPHAFFGWPAGLAATTCVLLIAVAAIAFLPATPEAEAPALHFFALAPLEAIRDERGSLVVAAQLPRSQLPQFGLPIDPARADVPAKAEFIVSPSGTVLAVRFIE